MKSLLLAIGFALLSGMAWCAEFDPVVNINPGKIRGREIFGVLAFKGIPYAAAPAGPLRWQPPQPAAGWTNIRDVGEFGPVCPQPKVPADLGGLDLPQSEDCLNLNIWSPKNAQRAPVMVWLHGGGFTVGSGAAPYYDGTAFARDGVVLVTLNYRLGHLGFFAHPALTVETPRDIPLGNYGLMDQLAALRWVQQNIAAFGGDPSNVTLAGESAGARSIEWLITLPFANTLFKKAIIESAGGWVPATRLESLEARGRKLVLGLGASDNAGVDELRQLSVDAILSAKVPGRHAPIIDGRLFSKTPEQSFAEGGQTKMPVLIGSNSFEAGIMKAVGVEPSALLEQTASTVKAAYSQPELTNDKLAEALFTDGRFGAPAHWFAAKMSTYAPTYVYYFSYVTSQLRASTRGANHGAELTYVFETGDTWLKKLHGSPLSDEDHRVAHLVHSCWVGFIRDGDPHCDGVDWPVFSSKHDAVLDFRTDPIVRTQFKSIVYDALEKAYLPGH